MSENRPENKMGRRGFLRAIGAGTLGAVLGGTAVERLLTGWHTSQNNAPPLPMTGRSVEPVTIMAANGIRIHNIQTGYVAVKRAHREYHGADGTGLLAIAADPRWTEWMPVNTWVIEHPEGIIVVDTGETARINQPGYVDCDPITGFIYGSFLRFAVTPEDEIASQLRTLGISVEDVSRVVQTHLHSDHVGGLSAFPRARFMLSGLDYPNGVGTLPCHYPPHFDPQLVDFKSQKLPGFDQTLPLTRAGDVWIVPTPGHTSGHQSVIFNDGQHAYFFAGDASFSEAQLLLDRTAGIAQHPADSRRTLTNIRTFARDIPTIYLPSHDPDSRMRFLNRITVSA